MLRLEKIYFQPVDLSTLPELQGDAPLARQLSVLENEIPEVARSDKPGAGPLRDLDAVHESPGIPVSGEHELRRLMDVADLDG